MTKTAVQALFRSGRAKALMDEAGFTTLLKRSLVSSESGRDERSLAPNVFSATAAIDHLVGAGGDKYSRTFASS